MYEYIRGVLTQADPSKAVVEAGGVGYAVLIGLNTYSRLPAVGQEALLYLSAVVREDSHKLFGFLAAAERDFFERLTEVSGIGPKTALALLGHVEIGDVHAAIVQEDSAALCKVPGIGKKTAERLIVELKDKVHDLPFSAASPLRGAARDALSALINLGYAASQAQKAVQASQAASADLPLADLITASLKRLRS
jgi:Holliday junction DNA helicase RuvA